MPNVLPDAPATTCAWNAEAIFGIKPALVGPAIRLLNSYENLLDL